MRAHLKWAVALVVASAGAVAVAWWVFRPRGTPDEILDLVSELRVAELTAETPFIDIGAPSARRHLVAGWGVDEKDARGTYRWVTGDTASISFLSAEPRPVEISLDCAPLVFEGMPAQIARVAINGSSVGEIRLGQQQQRHRIAVPAEAIVVGENRLELLPAHRHRPRDVLPGAEDARQLALRCYGLSFRGLGANGRVRAGGSSGGSEDRIHLPVGTSVTYYFQVTEPARLRIGALESWGPRADDVSLLIRFTTADGAEETVQRLASSRTDPDSTKTLQLPLPSAGQSIGRLELAATSPHRHPRESNGVTLVRPAIHTRAAPERPGSGPAAPNSRSARRRAPRPNIIIYLIDTLRADHLGVYGYPRPTSPHIDRFAADALLFENAHAQSSWTRPTVVSLLTGLAPRAHRVNHVRDSLPDSVETLGEILTRHGYLTVGFVTNGNAGPEFGLDRGFLDYSFLRESKERPSHHQLSDRLNASLFRWLEERPAERPFFLYAHATDPHAPYTPPEPFLERFAPNAEPSVGSLESVREIHLGRRQVSDRTRGDLIDLYDAEIAFNDDQFGRLLERLKELDLYDSSLIILLSDHGEEFFDHGNWGHGNNLYQEQLAVPLILKLPGNRRAGERIRSLANQTDVMPTLLSLLDLHVPAAITGRNLLSADEFTTVPSFAYLSRLDDRAMRSVTSQGWKLILEDATHPRASPVQLYQVAADPRETTDLAIRRPFKVGYLTQLMRRWELGLGGPAGAEGIKVPISSELRGHLEALGYL